MPPAMWLTGHTARQFWIALNEKLQYGWPDEVAAPPPPKPRGGLSALAGERSKPVRLGVRDHHTRSLCAEIPAPTDQWCARGPPVRAAYPRHCSSNAKSLAGQNSAGFLQISADFQKDNLRRHFWVRISHAQPRSRSRASAHARVAGFGARCEDWSCLFGLYGSFV